MIGAASHLTPTEDTIDRFQHVMEAETEAVWVQKSRKATAKLLMLLRQYHPEEGPKTRFVQMPVVEEKPRAVRVPAPRQRFALEPWVDDIGSREGVPRPFKITTADIQGAVARHYRLPRSTLLSDGRFARIVRPRMVSYWLARRLLKQSLPEIGRRTGGRDHTSVLHGVKKIERLLDQEHGLNLTIAAICNRLGCEVPK